LVWRIFRHATFPLFTLFGFSFAEQVTGIRLDYADNDSERTWGVMQILQLKLERAGR
jgi:hypothetical protein